MRNVTFFVFLTFWSLMLVSGLFNAVGRHVPNYPGAVHGSPNLGQVEFYVLVPSAFVLLNIILLIFSRRIYRFLIIAVLVLQLAIVLAFLALSGGGI